MNWDDLRFLLAVHRDKTLTAAARSLGVNHATVSRRLQSVERAVGSRLFDKTTEGYRPTAACGPLLEVAERMERELLSLDRAVVGQDARLAGPLSVTTVDIVAMQLATPLAQFCRAYPEISLELSVDYQTLSLSRREADVALRLTNTPDETLVGRKACRVEFALYGAKKMLAGQRTPGDLNALPWVGWHESAGARLTERWMRRFAPEAPISCRVDSAPVMREMVRAGAGVGFLPCFEGDALEGLERLREPEDDFGMDLWMLTHVDLRRSARVKAFIDFMCEAVRALVPRYAGELQRPDNSV